MTPINIPIIYISTHIRVDCRLAEEYQSTMARLAWFLFITILVCLDHDHGLVDSGCVVEKVKGWFKKVKNVFKKPANETTTVLDIDNFTESSSFTSKIGK